MSYLRFSMFVVTAALVSGAGAGSDPAPAQEPPAQTEATQAPDPGTRVLDLGALSDMSDLLDRIADRRVVFVGESHDRYEDHLNQLAVIEGLHARGKPLAIGMEFFQQPYQSAIDAYLAGDVDEAEFLRRTEYFDRWRFDYRLYRPILRFAREHGIPVIALNLEAELTRRVGEVGIAGLTEAERARIPAEIDRSDPTYRERIEAVFAMHPSERQQDVENFLEVQLLWDEGMAERAAVYLEENPERTFVVLAGSGHVEYGQGIPSRLTRRLDVPTAIILNGTQRPMDPDAADFFLYPKEVALPASGLLGVMLESGVDRGGAVIQGFAETSGAKDAGIQEGDRIVQIGDQPVSAYADVRIALLDKGPGEKMPVEVLRKRTLGADERLSFQVELH
ncbi:ChaN family lipoprotein [Thiocapsa bogorovii]|uniref:ChaN family lipoprotein n=1 Tax=Thiocapsa bogorovii TaxID=521689 RepID=UPI0038CD7368